MLNEIYRRRNDLAITGGALALLNSYANRDERFYGYGRHNMKPGTYFASEKKTVMAPVTRKITRGSSSRRTPPPGTCPNPYPTPNKELTRSKRKRSDTDVGSSSSKKIMARKKTVPVKRGSKKVLPLLRRQKRKGKRSLRSRKYRSRLRKVVPRGEAAYLKRGYVVTCESGGVIKGDQCVFIGHGTSPGDRVLKTLCYSLTKALFTKAGIHVRDMSSPCGLGGSTPATKYNLYLANEHQVTGVVTESALGFDSTSAFSDIGDLLFNAIRATVIDTSQDLVKYSNLILRTDAAVVGPVHVLATINLKNCFVDYKAVSSLKYQNRSYTAEAGDAIGPNENALNVDRIPLYGKKYYCRGSAFEYSGQLKAAATGTLISTNNTPFAIDDTTGLLLKTGQNSDGRLKEPPSHKMFKGVKKSKGLVAQPGIVLADVIKKTMKLPFSKFLNMLSVNGTANSGFFGTQYTFNARYGVVSMIAFEKALHATTDLVQVNYEVNQKHMCMIKDYKETVTAADFTQGGTAGIMGTLPTV